MRQLTVALLLLVVPACAPQGSATVSGQLQSGSFALDNPVMVATDEAGETFETYVTADLTFELPLPSGRTYSFALANSTRIGALEVISHVDLATADGLARYVVVDTPEAFDVGAIYAIDWTSATPESQRVTLHAKSNGKGKGNDGKGSAKSPDEPTCTGSSVVESAATRVLLGLHGAGGSGASAPLVADGGVGQGNGADETKVTICHIPPGNPANEHTITVGAPAVPAHLAHGDYLGACTKKTTPPPSSCPSSNGSGGSTADSGTTTDGGTMTSDGGTTTGGGGTTTGGGSGSPTGGAPDMAQSGAPTGTPPSPLCQVNADCPTNDTCFAGACAAVIQ